MIIVQAKVRCDHPDCPEVAKIDIRFNGNDNSNPNHKTWELHNKPEGWHIDMAAPYYKSGKQYCPAHQPVKKPKAKKPRATKHVIDQPASVEQTEKTFGITDQQRKHIDVLVDEALDKMLDDIDIKIDDSDFLDEKQT